MGSKSGNTARNTSLSQNDIKFIIAPTLPSIVPIAAVEPLKFSVADKAMRLQGTYHLIKPRLIVCSPCHSDGLIFSKIRNEHQENMKIQIPDCTRDKIKHAGIWVQLMRSESVKAQDTIIG